MFVRAGIRRHLLPALNPTSYDYQADLSSVQVAITQAFAKDSKLHLAWKDDGNPFAINIFSQHGTHNDAYLYNFHEPIGLSKVYFRGGEPLPYIASFHLRLLALDDKKTRVQVAARDSEVIAGLNPIGVHGPANIYVSVYPTTVEEYEILLRIGRELAESNMAPLILPKYNENN